MVAYYWTMFIVLETRLIYLNVFIMELESTTVVIMKMLESAVVISSMNLYNNISHNMIAL